MYICGAAFTSTHGTHAWNMWSCSRSDLQLGSAPALPQQHPSVALRDGEGQRRLIVRRGAGVQCNKGAMVVFNNILPNGETDPLTSHQSCPVLTGEKVVVSRFIREETCNLNKFFSWRKWNGNVFCEDDHTQCTKWAAQGHCTTSDIDLRERMIGDEVRAASSVIGPCLAACARCAVGYRREIARSACRGSWRVCKGAACALARV